MNWWPTIASGILWSIVVGLLDTLGEPLADLSVSDLAHFGRIVFLQWLVLGQIWAIAARLAERRGRALIGFVAALPICCAAILLTGIFIQWVAPGGSTTTLALLISNMRNPEITLYLAWENAFYGGIYMLGYVATRRSLRLRDRLADTLRARGEADMLLREAQLRAYRGQLQPELMIEALAALRARSRSDPAAADLMFDRLVTFLRAAMPAIRSGRSTLTAELLTLKAYGALRRMIRGAGGVVDVRWAKAMEDVPFPPLILLPTLEAIAAGLPSRSRLTLRVHPTSTGPILTLMANAPVIVPGEAASRLRAALRLTFGSGADIVTAEGGDPVLEVRLITPLTPSAADRLGGSYAPS